MRVLVQCQCGKYLSCDRELPGRQVQCTACGKVFVMPGNNVNPVRSLNTTDLWKLVAIIILASVSVNVGVFLLLHRFSTAKSIATVAPTGGGKIVESNKAGENNTAPLAENKRTELVVSNKNQEFAPVKVDLLTSEGLLNQDRGFIVTSVCDDTIHVDKVVYNGTYEAKIAMFAERGIGPMFVSNSRFPLELGIGESVPILWQFGEPLEAGRTPSSYGRDIEFLDVHTDRGIFRFSPSGEFIGQAVPKAGADTAKLTERENSNRKAEFKAAEIGDRSNDKWHPDRKSILDAGKDYQEPTFRTSPDEYLRITAPATKSR